ncbi:MAG TPA: YkgJ family cysteine cluster protein, partial [Polyangiaceae bacterium]|nr:YkgJ family cysteine cluster protein [Polyangiaceae bacterium]
MKRGANVLALIEASLRKAPAEARDFFDRERQAARAGLAAGDSATHVAEVVLTAADRLEPLVADLVQERPPACARGCSCCCHGLKIEVSAPEAVAIAEYLRGLAPEELEETREQLRDEAAFARTLDAATRWREQTACAFLDDASGECVIHAVRPFTCRAHTSMSVAACEAAARDPERLTPIERHPVPASVFGMTKSAITVACDEAGLDPRSFEITNAVSLALETDGVATRWARGEPVFDAAVTPNDDRDAELALQSLARQGLLAPERLLKRASSSAQRNAAKRARKHRRT